MDYTHLLTAVETHAAVRRRQRLQPVGGAGDKIFPPTYPGDGRNAPARHVLEKRRVAGQDVWCCLVDSVQSQANRLEEALQAGIDAGDYQVPHLVVDFTGHGVEPLTRVTSLEAPHRVYDAILRDSALDGKPFQKSPLGERLNKASPRDVSAILEVSPSSLVLGAWNSTGEGGGIGAKFQRSLVAEIMAVGVTVLAETETGEALNAGRRTGSRIDPLSILRRVEVFKGEEGEWDVSKAGAGKKAKQVRPSEINHGNIAPSVADLGITCDYAEQTAVLSFASLRRLRFGSASPEAVKAARAYLAALGLLKLVEHDRAGYALRSRCDLVPETAAPWELVAATGTADTMALERNAILALYQEALAAVQAHFPLHLAPVVLRPLDKLVEIIRRSQALALSNEDTSEGGEEG